MFRNWIRLAASAVLALGAATLSASQQEDKPAVDCYGDRLPPHAVARLGTLRFRCATGVHRAVVVPGGKQLLGLGYGPSVVLWDAATGKEIRRFEVPAERLVKTKTGSTLHQVNFRSFAVSPDGKTLAVAAAVTVDNSGLDCPLLLFDLATGRKLAEWTAHAWCGYSENPIVAFVSPSLLVSGSRDGSVRVWDAATKRELHRLLLPAGSHVSAIVPSPNHELIFVTGDSKDESFWMAWEPATGKLVHREKIPGAVAKLAVSPDGGALALAMGMGGPPGKPDFTEMRLYSLHGWKELHRWQAHPGNDAGRSSITFSPDGKTIATGGADGKVCRWDAATGKEIEPVIDPCQQHSQNVAYLDANTLFTFGSQSTVKFWDAAAGQPKRTFAGSECQITAVAYSADGRHIAVGGGDSPIRIWDAASSKQIAQLRDGKSFVTCLAFSPDGKWLASGDGQDKARLWDWNKGGTPIKEFADHKSPLLSIAFSPNGRLLAAGEEHGTVCVWDPSLGRLVHSLKGPVGWISALAFTADGKTLVSSAFDHGVRHWDLAIGKVALQIERASLGHSNVVVGLALSPGGRWGYSSSYDGSICVWEAGSGRLARILKEEETGYNGPVRIALSADGTLLAAAFVNHWENPAVHLWNLTTGQKVALMDHRATVTHLAFSPDGCRLVSGSCDTTALVWDLAWLRSEGKSADSNPLAGLWKDLGADDPKIAYAAVCRGAAAGDEAVARLKLDLKPAAVIDAEKIAVLVRQLDSESFAQREKASQALADLGSAAETALRNVLAKNKSLEARRRLKQVLDGQEAEHRRLANAVEVLDMIRTPAASCLLRDLANGASGSRLTRAARLALDRLEKKPLKAQ